MSEILVKTVRIDDKRYDPKGAKLEVCTKGRHINILFDTFIQKVKIQKVVKYY